MGAGDQLGAVGADVMAGWVGGGEMRHGSRIHGLGVGRVCRQAGPRGSGLQHMGAQWLPGLVCEGLTERPPGAVPREVTCGACGGKPWTRGVVLMLSFLCGVRASPDSPPCPPSVPWTPPPPRMDPVPPQGSSLHASSQLHSPWIARWGLKEPQVPVAASSPSTLGLEGSGHGSRSIH